MRVFVTGGTGFVGSRLVPFLVESGHTVRLLVRPGESRSGFSAGVDVVEGDSMIPGPWWDSVRDCEAAVNMAGTPIFGKWDAATKRMIRESRVRTTENLAKAIPQGTGFTLVSTSAVGVYGDAGERELDESAPPGDDFLASVARDWEGAALSAGAAGARVVLARFAIVLARAGAALEELIKVTKRFASGPVGSGRQWMSWIHREDLVSAILFLLENRSISGPVNLCSPNPVRQIDMARTLGRLLHRPAILPAPAFALRLALGEFADVVLFSQRMVPRVLLGAKFGFRFPDLEGAPRDILAR